MSRTDRTMPFHRITIENAFNVVASKAVLVEWEMEDWFVEDGPWTFELYRTKREDLTDWELVTTVVNQSFAYDTDLSSYTIGVTNYYKVKVITGSTDDDGNLCFYWSDALLAGNNLERRDWRLLREIIRKETMLMTKRTGARGWLLPFPLFGEPSENTDPNTGEILTSQDPDDYGTGKVGGYWGPIDTFAELSPEKRITRLTAAGKVAAIVRTATVLAYPRFRSRDVWVNGMTDERFTIGPNIATLASVRGVPIKYSVELDVIEAGNVIYSIPVPMQV